MSLVTAADAPHSRNKILVLGHDVQRVVDLLQRMLSLATDGECTISKSTTLSENEPALVVPWTIETKYYTARVDFWIDTCPAGDFLSDIMEAYDQIGGAIDAVMFVFNKGEPKKFDELSRWLPFVERHEPSITLCVADGTRQTQTVDPEINRSSERYEIWCLENGFEYIDAEAWPTEENDSGNGTYVERVGLDRVLEALQTHMWEGLKRKCMDDHEKMDAADTEEEEEKFMNELLNMKVHDLPDPDKSIENLSMGVKSDDDFTEFVGSENFGSLDEDDGFEKAYETLRDFRESSKDLPDSERKRLAAEVVLSFVKEFGD